MRCFLCLAGCMLALSAGLTQARAETPSQRLNDPARLLPEKTDIVVRLPQPRQFVETLLNLDLYQTIRQFSFGRELYDSTNLRRFRQLIAYFEKELGLPWPQLLDRLAARGAVVGVKIGPKPASALMVVAGDDDKLMRQFFQLALKILEQELARQEAKDVPVKGTYKGIDTVRVGNEFHAALAEGTLLFANSETALHAGLDRLHGDAKCIVDLPSYVEANKILPSDPLVSFWLNMETVKQSPQAKALYASPPRDDPGSTVLFGHYLDLLGRSPFVCAAIHRDKEGLVTSIRLPRGREGMGADRLLHIAPPAAPGTRPLLEPKNVLYSESNYFDLANVWKERKRLFNEKQVAAFEKFDNRAFPFLGGVKPSSLLTRTAPYYRFVAAHRDKNEYKISPKISIPAFALVWELREPEAFGRSMETILRGVALLTGSQVDLKLVEEKYKGLNLIGYRFPEEKPIQGDINDLRFNFTPCFTRVGDQFIVSSTVSLCRELVDIVQAEGTSPQRGDSATTRRRFYGAGVAEYLRTIEDLLITQSTLDRAVSPQEARKEMKAQLEAIRKLGYFSLEPRLTDKAFQYDIRLSSAK
jgi:hypothetical protein